MGELELQVFLWLSHAHYIYYCADMELIMINTMNNHLFQ